MKVSQHVKRDKSKDKNGKLENKSERGLMTEWVWEMIAKGGQILEGEDPNYPIDHTFTIRSLLLLGTRKDISRRFSLGDIELYSYQM